MWGGGDTSSRLIGAPFGQSKGNIRNVHVVTLTTSTPYTYTCWREMLHHLIKLQLCADVCIHHLSFNYLYFQFCPGKKSTKVPKPMEMYLTGGQVPRPIYLMRGGGGQVPRPIYLTGRGVKKGGGGRSKYPGPCTFYSVSSTQAHLPYSEGGGC